MSAHHYWVVDVEGNGANPAEIVELGMVEIIDFRITGNRRRWLVRPKQAIHPAASRIHGLTDADVVDAPSFHDIADDVLTWIEDLPIIGHNVRVEVDILKRSIPEWEPRSAIDTLKLAKILRPGLPSYGLEKLGAALNLSSEAAQQSGSRHHSAQYDATLTALLFLELLSGLSEERRAAVLLTADILDEPQQALL